MRISKKEKALIGKMFETSPQDEELKQRMFDDLITGGMAAWKTEIENGIPIISYVDPVSPEMRVAMYNAEHTDSAMQIHYQPITEKSYDGSKLNHFHMGFDPFYMPDVLNNKNSLYDRMIGIIRFRLPRKLKKRVKLYIGTKRPVSRRNLRFNYDVYKVSKYYNCKIKQEGGE